MQSNWNNAEGGGAQPLVPIDRDGNPTSFDVRWSLSNTWRHGGDATTDEQLASGYFDDGDSPDLVAGDGGVSGDGIGVSVTVGNITYPRYTVVLYLNSDQRGGGQFGTYTVNGQSQMAGSTPGDIAGRGWVLGENLLIFGGSPTLRAKSRSRHARG